MQQITLTFERIFDVYRHPDAGGCRKHTLFGFTANGKAEYGVTVPGWPPLEPGQTITALLDRNDDWQTLLGWVDHATGEITAYDAGPILMWSIMGGIVAALGIPAFFGAGSGVTGSGRTFGGCMIAGFTLLTIFSIAQWNKQKRVIRILNRLTINSARTPDGDCQ